MVFQRDWILEVCRWQASLENTTKLNEFWGSCWKVNLAMYTQTWCCTNAFVAQIIWPCLEPFRVTDQWLRSPQHMKTSQQSHTFKTELAVIINYRMLSYLWYESWSLDHSVLNIFCLILQNRTILSVALLWHASDSADITTFAECYHVENSMFPMFSFSARFQNIAIELFINSSASLKW